MAIYKVPVSRGRYTTLNRYGRKEKLPNYIEVDNKADYNYLSKRKIYGTPTGYAQFVQNGRRVDVHSFVASRKTGGVPYYWSDSGRRRKADASHLNGLPYDNRRSNLTFESRSKNLQRREITRNITDAPALKGLISNKKFRQQAKLDKLHTKSRKRLNTVLAQQKRSSKKLSPEVARQHRLESYRKHNAKVKADPKKYAKVKAQWLKNIRKNKKKIVKK